MTVSLRSIVAQALVPAAAAVLFTGCASQPQSSMLAETSCDLTPRQVVDEFATLFYEQKKVREAFETWVAADYIQHKPTLPDGREPVITVLEELLTRFPNRTFTIHRIIASDDLVAVHYHSERSIRE